MSKKALHPNVLWLKWISRQHWTIQSHLKVWRYEHVHFLYWWLQGKHVALLFVQYTPYEPKDGPWSEPGKKDKFADQVFSVIEQYAPGFKESIIGYDMLTVSAWVNACFSYLNDVASWFRRDLCVASWQYFPRRNGLGSTALVASLWGIFQLQDSDWLVVSLWCRNASWRRSDGCTRS